MNQPRHLPGRRRQSGVALIVVLILLMVMTLLGLASLRGTLMEERMSANLFDRSLAFQAAGSALREGEARAGAAMFERPAFSPLHSAVQASPLAPVFMEPLVEQPAKEAARTSAADRDRIDFMLIPFQ